MKRGNKEMSSFWFRLKTGAWTLTLCVIFMATGSVFTDSSMDAWYAFKRQSSGGLALGMCIFFGLFGFLSWGMFVVQMTIGGNAMLVGPEIEQEDDLPGRCPKCDYDWSHNSGGCPECGAFKETLFE